jgi:hypothetical protein
MPPTEGAFAQGDRAPFPRAVPFLPTRNPEAPPGNGSVKVVEKRAGLLLVPQRK